MIPSRRAADQPIDLETVFRSSGDEPLQDQMVRCTACGLHYVRPRLKWDLILAGYAGAEDPGFVSQAPFRERTFKKSLRKLERMAKPPGPRVLDVGAAGGSFLAAARERGYQPSGCEPSTWMCEFAKRHYGLELYPGTLFDMPLGDRSQDLVTLWDVIEHTPDPKAVLRRVREVLKDDGVLAMSWPDYASIAAKVLGSRWPFLLTVHLYYFTPATMTTLLRATGFEPVGYTPYWQMLEMGYVGQRAAPYLGPLGGVLTGALRALHLQRLPFQYQVGQTMVVAKKAKPSA